MKKSFLFLIPFLLLSACQQQAPQDDGRQAAVQIGQEVITENDVQARLRFLPEEDREFAQTPIGRQNFLQIIAREKLIAPPRKKPGFTKRIFTLPYWKINAPNWPKYLTILLPKPWNNCGTIP